MASGQARMAISSSPPPKRQRTDKPTLQSDSTTQSKSLTYDSEDDSGDELFENYYVPDTPTAAGKYETQPTQIIDRSAQKLSASTPRRNEVQVPASSPIPGNDTPSTSPFSLPLPPSVNYKTTDREQLALLRTGLPPLPRQVGNGAGQKRSLALTIAPAGTSYKPPHGVIPTRYTSATASRTLTKAPVLVEGSDDDIPQKATTAAHGTLSKASFAPKTSHANRQPSMNVITIPDDDDVQVLEETSSEDELNAQADIQPSTFKPKTKSVNTSFNSSSSRPSSGNMNFKSIVSNAAYNGPQFGATFSTKPMTSQMMSSYDGVGKPQLQKGPARALPVGEDIKLEEIRDPKLRDLVWRVSTAFPDSSILTIKNLLIQTKGNVDDVANLIGNGSTTLFSEDDDYIDNSSENPVQTFASPFWKKSEPPRMKLQKPKTAEPRQMNPQMKRVLDGPVLSLQQRYSSTRAPATNSNLPLVSQPKKKKLVQGLRNRSSPTGPEVSPPKRPSSPVISISDYDSDDSGVASENTEPDAELQVRVLHFLNTCTVDGLVEHTGTTKEYATIMIEARPFKTLDQADDVENPKMTKGGKKTTKAPIGAKIVQNVLDKIAGFEAIDVLVKNCDEIAKPLRQEMSTWGVDVFGAAKGGELNITSFDEGTASQRDSGIGSPSSDPNSVNGDADDDVKVISSSRKKANFIKQPDMMPTKDEEGKPLELKDYQLVGLNWLAMMYRHKLSGILADEMGLGKTMQVIALIVHLVETGNPGPHLVICPGSVVENWLREIKRFAPGLATDVYHGKLNERREQAERILQNRSDINIVVTTYDVAAQPDDNKFLRQLKSDACIYDEGHYLKNVTTKRYKQLIKIPAVFKLLLTGTPLQNNLQELASLLAFILPEVFQTVQEPLEAIFKAKATTRDTNHTALLSEQRISRARSMLTPFILRRKKHQVMKHLPPKTLRVEYCELSPSQSKIYDGHVEQARERARARIEGIKMPKRETLENNPLMQLRKAAIHPLLFRRHFTDEVIEEMADILRQKVPEQFPSSQKRGLLIKEMHSHSDFKLHIWCSYYPCVLAYDIPDLAWMDSGKVEALIKLLKEYKEKGYRVLIFSQFALALDILEKVLNTALITFMRIDGSTNIEHRQTIIDTFTNDESITAFLLTTKAGGTGLNLMAANKVIIFDGSFNPHDDKQAEDRAHRVGQTRDVEVVRLVTRDSIEEQIYALGQSKLMLDGKVSGNDEGTDAAAQLKGEAEVTRMFLAGEKAASDGSTPVIENLPPTNDEDDKKNETGDDKNNETGDKQAAETDDARKADAMPKGKKPSIFLETITCTRARKSTTEKDTEKLDVEEAEDEMLI